jgi:hypothetical protein
MDTLLLILWLLFLFVALPLAVGLLAGQRKRACVAWAVLAGLMALSQSSDDDLGGLWPVVVLVAAAGLPLVLLGTRLRSRGWAGGASVGHR